MRKNVIKILVFFLNIAVITAGILYIKEKEDKKKEEKLAMARADNMELAKFNVEKTQEIMNMVRQEKESYLSSNSGEVVVQQEKIVEKTIPAVTQVVVEQKKVPASSSSKSSTTTKTS